MIDPSQIDFSILPQVLLEDRSRLPDAPGVYFAISSNDEVIYIGKGRRLVMRWSGTMHHRYQYLSALKNIRIAWAILDESQLDDAERTCIDYFKPPLNGSRRVKQRPVQCRQLRSNILVLAAEKGQRERRRISLRKIAEETGIQPYTVYGFANNPLREYPDSVLDILCNYFGCQIGDLLILGEADA